MQIIETDILIVGGGVAGSALACALRGRGYRIVLVDHRKSTLDTARGDHLQPFTVELLDKWGVLPHFLERGAGRRIGHEFRATDSETLLSARYDELPIPHPYFLVFNHEMIAELMLELAEENPNFLRLQPVSARDFEIVGDSIRSVNIQLPDGEPAAIVPRLVVGADGTNSIVRSKLMFRRHEHQYEHPMVAVFGARPAALQPQDYFFRYAGKTGMLVIQQRMDGKIKVTLPVGDEGILWWKKSSKDERAEVFGARSAVLRDFDSEIAGFYPVKMIRCDEYAKGNVVLIGDAAHSIHPARGQGLNMGIQSLPQLIESLPPPKELGNAGRVRDGLQKYQTSQKARYDRVIARNHELALEMDSTAGSGVYEVIRRQDEELRQTNRQPELRRHHLLEVTGYPFGIVNEDGKYGGK